VTLSPERARAMRSRRSRRAGRRARGDSGHLR
jgi:hypothetical protein